MTEDPREGLWDELSTIEDWLGGALRRDRGRPDLQPIASLESTPLGASPLESAPFGVAQAESAPPAAKSQDAAPARPARADAATVHTALAALRQGVGACQACRLATSRHNTVFGTGSEAPLVLVVGEGPGAEEDSSGLPFVGPAGKLLDRMLGAIGLSREENVFIANVVKCRPPGNRDPAPDEMAACMHWLESTIDSLAPLAILCLGRTAMRALSGSEEGITRMRGRWLEYRGIPLIATYHPSALLRDESLKRPAWEDLKALKERIPDAGDRP